MPTPPWRATKQIGGSVGPAETDLVAGSLTYPLIIEVKLFTRRPSELQLERALGQLLKYMDQAPYKSRGALVLFNLSDVSINAGKEFIGGRVALIAINMTSRTPSTLEESIEVRSSTQPGRLIDVLGVGRAPKKRQRKRTKPGVTRHR